MAQLLKINPTHPDSTLIQKARDYITNGKLVIFPTDTVYGLATDPFNENAVKNLLKIKKRDQAKGLPVLVSNLDIARDLAEFSERALSLASQFWPGALTIILPLKKPMLNEVTGNRKTLGIRVPSNKIARELAKIPIIGTSANISGHQSPTTAEGAVNQLGQAVHLVLDGGPSKKGLPSTIIDLSGGQPQLLREGSIKYEELHHYLR